jgi:hypothetical protein
MVSGRFLGGRRIGLACLALSAFACKPDVPGRPSIIDDARVIAVRSIPAEAQAGEDVQYEALYVGPDGDPDPAALNWALCTERKPLAVSGPIALECLAPSGDGLTPIESGAAITDTLPSDVCSTFGPEAPVPEEGGPTARPSDPDSTGGYYQVVRVLSPGSGEDAYSVGVTRLDCGVLGLTPEQSIRYGGAHRANENPAIDSLVVERSGEDDVILDAASDEATLTVGRGEHVTFHAAWAECSGDAECEDGTCSDEPGCTGSEAYLNLDQVAHDLVTRREAIRVSWFGTAGSFDHDRTGRTEADTADAFSDNEWTAPETSGKLSLWVVIRDDRGGTSWNHYVIDVE